ncbi:MAG TPA: hypothetical protein VFU27_09815 [Terriglobales bacterium]|nr:hypothetical protein [Terriglobales bacterium]
MKRILFASIASLLLGCCAAAQVKPSSPEDGSIIQEWLQASSRADASQPHWMAPLFTVTPRLVQQFRYDLAWQTKGDATTANYGSGKGLELIPTDRTEVLISAPPYLTHSGSNLRDGWGDMTFLFKYRLAAANEKQGNYVVTAFLATTVPTGMYSNGAARATFTPTLAVGKGWGNFDVQATMGVLLPGGDLRAMGTPVGLNTTLQYRVLRKLWPEVEINSTLWGNGSNSGKKQVFFSPGLVAGRFHLWRRFGFAVGSGVQIAATRFHTYNHAWVMSVRFPF